MTRLIGGDAMRWLVWKDYRANRLIFGTAVFLLVAPLVAAVVHAVGWSVLHGWDASVWWEDLGTAIVSSLYLMQLTLGLFGGSAIAGERTDRSAEFLAALPISRGRKVASKLWVALGLWALTWAPFVAMVVVGVVVLLVRGDLTAFRGGPIHDPYWPFVAGITVTSLTFFCVAWMFSAMLESATFAAGAGLIAPFLVIASITSGSWILDSLGGVSLADSARCWFGSYVSVCLVLSIVCFTVGTRHYLRRVEP